MYSGYNDTSDLLVNGKVGTYNIVRVPSPYMRDGH
jgi:hypothetical protein